MEDHVCSKTRIIRARNVKARVSVGVLHTGVQYRGEPPVMRRVRGAIPPTHYSELIYCKGCNTVLDSKVAR